MSEEETIEDVRAGKLDAYASLVEKYQETIFSLCMAYLKREDLAEETAQETFIKAYRSMDQLKETAKFRAWLKRIAINLCRDYLKRNRPVFVSLENDILYGGFGDDVAGGTSIYGSSDAISESTESRLYESLYRLDFDKRNILALHYFYELPIRSISQRLSLSESAVKKRLERARTAMRKEASKMTDRRAQPRADMPERVIELIRRPNLVETPDNPVNAVWLDIRSFLSDYALVEGDELVSKEDHRKLVPSDTGLSPVEVDENTVLRPHATTIVMEYVRRHPTESCKILGAGRVWRDEGESSTRSSMFHQVDAMRMGTDVKEGDVLTEVTDLIEHLLPKCAMRLERHDYPFVKRGWALGVESGGRYSEVLGAGLITGEALASFGVDPSVYQAASYGMGLERLAMIRYGMDTIQDATRIGT